MSKGVEPLGGFPYAQLSHELIVVVTVQAGRVDELDDPADQGNFPRPSGDGPPGKLSVNLNPGSPFDPSRQLVVPVVREGGSEPAQQQLSRSERIVGSQDRGVWGDVVDGLPDEKLLEVGIPGGACWSRLGVNDVAAVGCRGSRPAARKVNA